MGTDLNQVPAYFLLYENIENIKEIKELLLRNELNAAVINPEFVYHKDQLLIACHRSLYNERTKQMKTKSLFTELLYNLYPNRRISESLKTLGVQES
ncbi:TP53RK-binding protein, partial [Stegodyphus mimosarum]